MSNFKYGYAFTQFLQIYCQNSGSNTELTVVKQRDIKGLSTDRPLLAPYNGYNSKEHSGVSGCLAYVYPGY